MGRARLFPLAVGASLLLQSCGDTPATPTGDRGGPTPDLGGLVDEAPRPALDAALGDNAVADLFQVAEQRPRTLSATSPVTFSHSDQPFNGVSLDTGWVPSGSAVQIRFATSITGTAEAVLPGTGRLEKSGGQLDLTYAGVPAGGKVKMDIGFAISAKLKISVTGFNWEGNLPLVPQFDLRFVDEEPLTAFVLAGAAPRPVHLEDTKPKQQLFQVPIPGLSISWGPITLGGVVLVKAGGTISGDFSGVEIATTLDGGGPTLVHTSEGQVATTLDRGKNPEHASAIYKAAMHYSGTITLYPTITVTAAVAKWEVAEFAVPIDISTFGPVDHVWSFAPRSLTFEMK